MIISIFIISLLVCYEQNQNEILIFQLLILILIIDLIFQIFSEDLKKKNFNVEELNYIIYIL